MLSNLRNKMWEKKISIKKIAEKIGICPSTLSEKINGETKIWLEESMKIKREFFPDENFEELFEISEPNKGG